MKIELTQGYYAEVDEEDYERVSQYKWTFSKSKKYTGYAIRQDTDTGKFIKMHRFILGLIEGDPDVDHIDNNGLNNRRNNLRLCTSQQNQANRRHQKSKYSCFKGVTWNKVRNKWVTQIMFNYKNIYLGLTDNEYIAATRYDMAAVYLFGKFARINFPDRLEEYLNQREELIHGDLY